MRLDAVFVVRLHGKNGTYMVNFWNIMIEAYLGNLIATTVVYRVRL